VPGGGEKISEKNPDGGSTQQPAAQQQYGSQTNPQKHGPQNQPKDGLIRRIVGLLNPILNGGNQQQNAGLIIKTGSLLIPIVEATQGRPQNLLHTVYCTLSPNALICQGESTGQGKQHAGLIIRTGSLLIPIVEATQGRPQGLLHTVYCTLSPNALICQGESTGPNTNDSGEPITITPTSGPPGTTVTVKGSGWQGYQDVPIQIDGKTLAMAHPDANGNFSVNITIPKDAAPGSKVRIDALYGNGGSANAWFDVTGSGTGTGGGTQGGGGPNSEFKIELPLERTWQEPAGPKYANHCGPGATQVALDVRLPADDVHSSGWQDIDTIADDENTVRNGFTYMDYTNPDNPNDPNIEKDIVGALNKHLKLNNDPNPNWYTVGHAKGPKDFEDGILRNLQSGYAVVTGVNTAGMPGWGNYTGPGETKPGVSHVVTVIGFSQTADGTKYVKYIDTAGPDSGYKKGTSPEHTIPLSEFWTYVSGNNVQAWGTPTPKK
jgi:hypothetical protein